MISQMPAHNSTGMPSMSANRAARGNFSWLRARRGLGVAGASAASPDTTVDLFAQAKLFKGGSVQINANNVFNTLGIFEVNQATVPANGIGFARAINGRTISASLRFDF